MSRTYRLRHMPTKGAAKCIDSNIRTRFIQRGKVMDEFVEKVCPELNWSALYHAQRLYDEENPPPVVCKSWYGWTLYGRGIVRSFVGCRAQTWYKTTGHRRVRQLTRQALLKDPDEAIWPHPKLDAFNTMSLWL